MSNKKKSLGGPTMKVKTRQAPDEYVEHLRKKIPARAKRRLAAIDAVGF